MTLDKLNNTIDFCIKNKAQLTLSIDNGTLVFIDFNIDDRYTDTHIDEQYNYFYFWNYMFNHWNAIHIDRIDNIQIQID